MSAHFPQHSPTAPTSHAHPPSRHNSISQSPLQTMTDPPMHRQNSGYYTDANGTPAQSAVEHSHSVSSRHDSYPKVKEEPKASNPMSFSNILSSNTADAPDITPRGLPPTKQFRKTHSVPNGDVGPPSAIFRKSSHRASPVQYENSEPHKPSKSDEHRPYSAKNPKAKSKAITSMSDKENHRIEQELVRIDAMELSDIESPEWAIAKQDFARSRKKRLLDLEKAEDSKCKVSHQTYSLRTAS